MSKFIVPTHMTDDCTWSETEYVAVDCDSEEELYSALIDAIKAYIQSGEVVSITSVCGSMFDLRWFVYTEADGNRQYMEVHIIPLDDWFRIQKQIKWN